MFTEKNARKDQRQKEKRVIEDKMLGWHHQSMEMNLSKLRVVVRVKEAWRAAVHGVAKNWTRLEPNDREEKSGYSHSPTPSPQYFTP